MNKVIIIVGPTASGKTNLSIKVAQKLNSEIINGDAMQVYRGLDILTAKIKKDEMAGIPHHLFSFVDPQQNYSVDEYKKEVTKVIADIHKKNKIPIIVGGTGLYIKAALYDYQFEKQNIDNEIIEKKYENYSNQELYDYLVTIDEESALKTHPNNKRRVLRAIQIYETIGKTKSEINKTQNHELLYDCLFVGIAIPREELAKRIDLRVEKMFAEGIVDEVKDTTIISSTASAAIGYKQIKAFLEEKISLQECKNDIKLKTKQYSKRQNTWLKHQFDVNWFEYNNNLEYNIHNFIMRWLND